MVRINVTVDGIRHQDDVEPRLLLVHYLRNRLGLVGTPVGCDTSNCGSCTVLVDNRSAKSCTLLAVQADGAEITTIEGMAKNGELHPLQEAFRRKHGLQCGFCTPGMLATAQELLTHNPNPTESEIRSAICGNLCRCTGYQFIVDAIKDVSS
jgi:aerobic carbon-monoxide dehydrogenase small subunit